MAEKTTVILEALMNVTDVESKIGRIQKGLKALNIPKDVAANLTDGLNKLGPLLKDYKKQLNNGFSTQKDVNNFNTLGKKIDEVFSDIDGEIQKINSKEIKLNVDLTDIKNTRAELARQGKELENTINSTFNKIGDGLKKKNPNFDLNFLRQGPVAASLKPIGKELAEAFNTRDIERYRAAYEKLLKTISGMSASSKTKQNLAKQMGLDEKFINDADKVNAKITELLRILRIPDTSFGAFEEGKAKLESTDQALNKLLQDAQSRGEGAFSGIANDINNTQKAMQGLTSETSSYGDSMATAAGQVRDLQQSTQYFFSLRNMLNLLKRGIDDAVQSVKELDAAMTETAVVTDYKVSDLWGMLPQYTQLANQLGATTQGAYETMTLYFQQGLDQQQAFEIGAETMKMARIAGLDYAETTDMMTAALRGFNMELNETSAKRINDVYSELAAITASDTEELGTAMQRTASIAHSAGMSFEGTTAFLAQAIETTREPAENIGTAMKTIVARFQEMKENPLEISEVDGEEVDYNKVDAALQSIGVSLKDTNGQFRELDQVFLDISSRWDGLSQTQQRYIATVAAGSRQQSRFIAMMDNYDRTMQLFEAANNSAGASDEQFGKTMDSLESKLNKLHNAWQQFTMGIANNSMIKLAVDGMTGLLTVTNKLINAFSLGFGPLKSFLSIFTAFTGLKVAGRAANSLIGGLGGLVDPQSTVKEGLKIGLFGQGKTNTQAQAITTPIVGVLNKISGQIAQIKNNGVNNKGQSSSEVKNTSKQEYANIKAQFDKLSGKEGFKMSDASKLFGKLDAKHQLSMFNNNPGTKTAMKKASMAWFDSKGFSKEFTNEGKQYISAIYKGMEDGQIPVDKGAYLIGRPDLWGEHFATDAAKSFSNKYAQSLTVNEADLRNAAGQMAERFSNEQLSAMTAEEYNRYADDLALKNAAERLGGHGEAKGKVSDLGRLANDIGSIGDKFTQAGYGITTFGNALSQLGGPIGAVGTGIAAFGGAISSMGMMVSSATSLITVFSEGIEIAGTSIAISGGAIAAVAAPLAAAAAAFLLVRAHIKKVKEEGEKVTTTFNDINKETSDNISKLKSYQTEFATLSQGVDSNGNNVSLDDSQYQRYLEIVDDIAKINPEIVQGYNAQGHAIIDNNKALDETLKKQQQIKKEALNTYTETGSLQKLINARNVDSNYTGTKSHSKLSGVGYGQYGVGSQARLATTTGGMASDVFKIADELRLIRTKDGLDKTLKVDDKMLQKYGIESMDALISGEEQAVKNFIKHRDKIQAELTNSGFELSNSLIKGFDKLNEDQKAFDEAIQPVYDNLLASISNSPFYKEIGSEFRSAIALGLKDIASQDLNASEMQSQANTLVQEFDNLTREGGRYATAMEQVESAQDKFASSLDASEYAQNTEGALRTLNSLLKEYKGNTTAYGQAVTEYLTNQIEKIKNFTEEGSISLTEALNGMTNTISAAEGAYDSFQESTKTDFSTGAQSMKSIFEEVTKETDGVMLHMEKFGDATMWKGARALLGDEFVEKNGENVELVKKELLSLKSELQDGEKGFAAFWDNFKKVDDSKIEGFTWNKDGSYDIDRDINPDAYKEIAEQMHRSEEYVVSMLNKGRQFASIDFTNIDDVRKALSTDSGAIAGTSTTGGNTDLYVKKDYLQNAMSEAGIVNPSEQAKETEKLLAKGVKVIPNANDITKQDFQNMGIKDLSSLIQKFGDTGQFNRSEIEEYAQHMKDYNAGEFETLYQDYLDSQEHPELPSINSIDNNVASIASMIAQNHGIADQATKDAYKEDSKLVYGENGKGGDPDSLGEFFAKGQNKFGQNLTADEYKATKKTLENLAAAEESRKTFYETQAKKATQEGRAEDADWFNKAAKNTQKKIDYLTENLEDGAKAYKKAKENEKKGTEEEKEGYLPSSAKAAKDKAERESREKAEREQWQHSRENYEQQARNTSKPTKLLEQQKKERDAQLQWQRSKENYEQQAQNTSKPTKSLDTQAQEKIEQQVRQEGPIITNGLVSSLTKAATEGWQKEQQKGFVIDEKFAAYTGQASSAFNEKVKESAIQLGSLIKDGWDSLSQAETSIPAQNTSFVTKVTSSAQKLGEALKNGWNALQNNTPSEPATQSVPTINQGTSTVANVAQEVVKKVTTQESGLDETQQKLDTIDSTASKGAEMKVSTADSAVQSTLTAIQGLQSVANKGVSVKTTTTSGGGADQIKNAAAKGADMPIRVNDQATPKIKTIENQAKKPVSKTVNISPHFTGSWQHSVYLSATGPGANRYTGQNNKISYHHIPLAGSAARGTKKGRVGPRGQGGLTLTGETGYEVAWLPSENRSMILGASGPEMINLPKDAVIYNHDQSKEIMKKRQGISAGSMDNGGPYNSGSPNPTNPSKKIPKTTTTKSSTKSSKKDNSSVINNWSIEEVVRFDIDRKLETLASKIKKATDDIDKKLSKIGLRASGIAKDTQAQVKNLQAVKNYNDNLVTSYTKDLDKLRGGPYKTKISYDTGSGKKNKSKEETINLANYIYRDGNGDYQIDRNAIAKAGSVAKQEAIFKAAESALNPLVSGLQKAKDAAADAQKQMDELGKKVSETFYQWENEITEVYNLTQRISHDESLRARFSSQVALQLSKLKASFGDTAQSINIMHQALERDNKVLLEQIENQQKMIGARQRELNTALSAQDELDELNRLRAKSYDITATKDATIAWATNNYEGARLGRSYLNNVRQDRDGSLRYDIDWERFEKDRQANPYNKDTYEAIKKYLDELNSATDEFNKSIQEQTDLIKETYDALREYQDYVADFEDTLLKGFEEEIKNNIENSKKISESISNTLKDLLDQVKRKLDERRQQEDNRKTEDDISRKQQRLAMLRADTSGGHAAEIAQLESEIADSQQSYQRTLEDQLLDKLQQQGDEAAKQRERQIEIAQAQLEVATNGNSAIVDLWLRDPEAYKEEIKKAWLEAQGYDEKGEAGQYILANQFESEFANLVTAISQSGFSDGFKAIGDDTNTLVSLLTQLTEGRDALTDSLSKAVGALQDVENRDTQSFEQSKHAQLSAAEWKKEGQTASSLKAWNYTFDELKKSGFTNAELKQAGFGIKDFITGGVTNAKDLKASGFTATNLKNEGYTLKDLLDASFNGTELKNAGFGAKEFKQNEVAYNIAKAAGFDLKTLSSAGYSEATAELKKQADAAAKEAAAAAAAAKKKTQATNTYNSTLKAAHKSKTVTASQLKTLFSAGDVLKYSRVKVMDDLASGDGSGGVTWKKVLQAAKQAGYSGKAIKSYLNGHLTPTRQKAFESVYGKWSKFATGGLANYTGPAWLDGTPSKPELVLNATDTKNFIALKDVLAHAMGSTGQINNSYGGNATYEININVDHLNNDYDVDKVVERVKKKIVQDAGYRNVTQVRKFR